MTDLVKAWFICLLFGLVAGGARSGAAPAEGKEPLQQGSVFRHTTLESGLPISWARPSEGDLTLRTDPVFLKMEKSFLEGKISAKEFTRFIFEERRRWASGRATNAAPLQAVANRQVGGLTESADPVEPADPARESGAAETDSAPVSGGAVEGQSPQVDMADLESRMAELFRLRRERQQSAQTNSVQVNLMDPESKLSKRERLNLLLRYYIENKISAAEYEEQRARIIAQP